MPILAEHPPVASVPAGSARLGDFPGPARRLFTVKEYEILHRTGILRSDERVELIEGELIRMSPIGGPHVWVVIRLTEAFQELLHEEGHPIVVQGPLILGDRSEPQPDLTILRPDVREKGLRVPRAKDALLVVEVSDSTLRADLGPKAMLYAKHRVPEYWVFDLAGRRAIIHRDPSPKGYRTLLEARPPESIAPLALPKASVDLSEILRGCE